MTKSSNSDNIDKAPKDKQSDSDNPFIRFRHFADEQFSSILQGFIGLPSTFAKPQSDSQWSVFDEDLKRRDELQTRRRQLKAAEEARSANSTSLEEDEVQIPVKKSQKPHRQVNSGDCLPEERTGVFRPYDGPLYSVLFSPTFVPSYNDARHTMGSFAAMLLYKANPGDISLIPYLLGSPYSPLVLSLTRSPASPDNFPYCEAFEDLLLTTQGKERRIELPNTRRMSAATDKRPGGMGSTLDNGLNWIERLRGLGILYLPNPDSGNDLEESGSFRKGLDASNQDVASSISRNYRLKKKDAETEEQMYKSFLTDASTTPDQFFDKLESTFTAVERLIKSKNVPFEDSCGASPPGMQEVKMSDKSIRNPTESKREVSSYSTVEHWTDEDGNVETTIRVWKRFDDGSETETTSSHKVDEASRQRDNDRANHDIEGFLPSHQKAETDSQENESRTKKNTKPGWFWN